VFLPRQNPFCHARKVSAAAESFRLSAFLPFCRFLSPWQTAERQKGSKNTERVKDLWALSVKNCAPFLRAHCREPFQGLSARCVAAAVHCSSKKHIALLNKVCCGLAVCIASSWAKRTARCLHGNAIEGQHIGFVIFIASLVTAGLLAYDLKRGGRANTPRAKGGQLMLRRAGSIPVHLVFKLLFLLCNWVSLIDRPWGFAQYSSGPTSSAVQTLTLYPCPATHFVVTFVLR
jgi:hypothetical protein